MVKTLADAGIHWRKKKTGANMKREDASCNNQNYVGNYLWPEEKSL